MFRNSLALYEMLASKGRSASGRSAVHPVPSAYARKGPQAEQHEHNKSAHLPKPDLKADTGRLAVFVAYRTKGKVMVKSA
jgi:hypothetical protein